MDLVTVSVPKPPESTATTSPPARALACATSKVRQGSWALHGFASEPTTETKVRCASAHASTPKRDRTAAASTCLAFIAISLDRGCRRDSRRGLQDCGCYL